MFLGRTDMEGFMLKYTLYLCSLYFFSLLSFCEDRVLDGRKMEDVILSGGLTYFFSAPVLEQGR